MKFGNYDISALPVHAAAGTPLYVYVWVCRYYTIHRDESSLKIFTCVKYELWTVASVWQQAGNRCLPPWTPDRSSSGLVYYYVLSIPHSVQYTMTASTVKGIWTVRCNRALIVAFVNWFNGSENSNVSFSLIKNIFHFGWDRANSGRELGNESSRDTSFATMRNLFFAWIGLMWDRLID